MTGLTLSLLSVVVPARDEADCVEQTLQHLHEALTQAAIPHEIVVVDDGSTDETWDILRRLQETIPGLRPVSNPPPHGFGRAVTRGLDEMKGDAVVIYMADESDDSADVVRYWTKLQEGWDCVFGSRFMAGGKTYDYPKLKLVLNRIVNSMIRHVFRIHLNDTTNAFKAYRRAVIEGCRPILSPHFNLTVELPLKSIVRGYSWTIMPISWRNRRAGRSKLALREMGSRYFFIVAYVLLEKYFSRGDYRKRQG
jgi:dolichol-phosphate mannosyltransferase